MNHKTRALLTLILLLAAQVACSNPLPSQSGAGSQLPRPVDTFTSVPPFPTDTITPLPSLTATSTRTPRPTYTPTSTATPPVLLKTLLATLTAPPEAAASPNPRSTKPVIVRYLSTPPRLDGDWAEWKGMTDEYPANNLVEGGGQWTGPEDLSASFRLGWDDKNLYLGVKVRDDHYVQSFTGSDLYNGDSLELLLDTELSKDATSATLSDDDFQLGLSPGHPTIGRGQIAYLWTPNWLGGPQKTIQIEASTEGSIYRVEVALPWAVFQMKPAAGQYYGFALSVTDNDNADSGVLQTIISSLPARHPGDPTTWGDMLLVK